MLSRRRKMGEGYTLLKNMNENIPNDNINKKVCVIGQGFVGLPLALSFALRGCITRGVDIDENLVSSIKNGETNHKEKYRGESIQKILKMQLKNKRYSITSNGAKATKNCNNIIVTVGIPIKDGHYNMSYIEDGCRTIGSNIKHGDLIVIRSTVIPGTTEGIIKSVLEEESKMKAGVDFYLAYSPERIAEGAAFSEFENMPILVGGINEESLNRAIDLLSIVCKAEIIKASSIMAAEISKVIENAQRDVNVAMVQEFARLTEAMNIDIFEVVNLANTHKRVNLLYPGPGVGGYCIPNAYYYLAIKAESMGIDLDILKLSRKENSQMPSLIVNKLKELLIKEGKKIENSKIGVLGLAMKDYSSDDRISPAVDICNLIMEAGAQVAAFDPAVKTDYEFKVKTQEEALNKADAMLVLVRQRGIELKNMEHIVKTMNERPICIDCKGKFNKDDMIKFGFTYWKI